MKTLLKPFVFVLATVLIAISCQKILTKEDLIETTLGKGFNMASVKDWYYGTFQKTTEWSGAVEKSRQLPDWENGMFTTIEKMDAVVFPFIKGRSSFSIPGDKSLTTAQSKKIAAASLSKIAFIKTSANQIKVLEIDYIPDWEYLQSKQFNIGEMKGVDGKPDFTGRIVTKDWQGNILSMQIQTDGKTVKIGKRVDNKRLGTTQGDNTESIEEEEEMCTYTQYCVWQQDCVVTIYGDGMMTDECGEWYNTGDCWIEEYCPPEGGGGEGGGGGENPDPGADITVERELLIKKQLTAYENWEIVGTVSLSGRAFNNPTLNYFSSCTSPGSARHCYQPNCAWNLHSLYTEYTELSRTTGLTDPQHAAASFNTKIVYPNWPGGANTVYYQGSHIWFADTDLHL